jgi:hypothetical protein
MSGVHRTVPTSRGAVTSCHRAGKWFYRAEKSFLHARKSFPHTDKPFQRNESWPKPAIGDEKQRK